MTGRSDVAVGVCGFGRCGSTMVMSMLAAGGMPIAGNITEPPYELPDVRDAWKVPLAGRAVKLLDSVLYYGIPPSPAWRFVWLDRDPVEQARSHIKFVEAVIGTLDEPWEVAVAKSAASFVRDRPKALGALHGQGAVLVLRYERILADPAGTARLLAQQVWPDLNIAAAAGAVHDRDSRCLPDLAVEISQGLAAGV